MLPSPATGTAHCGESFLRHRLIVSCRFGMEAARISDIEPLFVCQGCGERGADIRPDFDWEELSITRYDAGGA